MENEELNSNEFVEVEVKETKTKNTKSTKTPIVESINVDATYLVRLNSYVGKTYMIYKGIKIYLSKDIELKASELAKLNPIMSSLKVVRK